MTGRGMDVRAGRGSEAVERAASAIARRSGAVLVATAVLVAVLAAGIPKLEFATGQDSYLNAGDQVAIDNEEYQSLFGGQAIVVLFTVRDGQDVTDLLAGDDLEAMAAMDDDLRAIDGVAGVVSPRTALEFTDALVQGGAGSVAGGIVTRAIGRETEAGRPDAAAARTADAGITLARLAEVPTDEQVLTNPAWLDVLLFDNTGFALDEAGALVAPPRDELRVRRALWPFFPVPAGVEPTLGELRAAETIVRVVGNASIAEEGVTSDAVRAAADRHPVAAATTVVTGAPPLLKELNDYLQGGMLSLGAVAAGVMLIVLVVLFRVRWRLLPLASVLLGVVAAFGLLGHLGFSLSLVTISGLPILIGMGIDYAIQLHARVEEEIALDHHAGPFAEATRHLVPAMLVSVVAAVLAFSALRWSAVPMVRDFAVLLGVGILTILAIDLLVPLAVLGARERRSPTLEPVGEAALARAVAAAGRLPQIAVLPLTVVAVGLFGFGVLVEDAFVIQTDAERWVDQDSQVIADLDQLKAETGSTSELAYYVVAPDGATSDEVVALVAGTAREELARSPESLLTASSIATTVDYLLDVPGLDSPLLPTGEDVDAALAVAPDDVVASTVSADGTAANLVFRTGPSALEVRRDLVADIGTRLEPPDGVRMTASGLAVVGIGLLENLEKNRAELTYIALALVLVFLVVRSRSAVTALVTLVPVAMAVGVSSIIIAGAGFELSPMTTISGPLVIANCTEFCVLILGRHVEERRQGCSIGLACDRASRRTGEAFVASALTTIGGFAVLVASPMPLLSDFGLIVTLNVGVALLSALVVLPPLVAFADEHGMLRATRHLDGT